jgi:SAM-dependent methyltransferase
MRRRVLARRYAMDPTIVEAGQGLENHRFLLNPASHTTYRYLTTLVSEVSRAVLSTPGRPVTVLDWGSGRGHVTHLLQREGLDVTPADAQGDDGLASPAPLFASRPVTVLDHPWLLPFDDGQFDAVLSFGVLEHVPDDKASLAELYRVLRPGGLLFCFNLPAKTSWTQRIAHLRGNWYHDRLYSIGGTTRLLQAQGFEVWDVWRRQLLPKNTVSWPLPHVVERLDQVLTEWTPLGVFATSIEFIAAKPGTEGASQR